MLWVHVKILPFSSLFLYVQNLSSFLILVLQSLLSIPCYLSLKLYQVGLFCKHKQQWYKNEHNSTMLVYIHHFIVLHSDLFQKVYTTGMLGSPKTEHGH